MHKTQTDPLDSLTNPKPQNGDGESPFYRFYAAYNRKFVSDVIHLLELHQNSKLLDPWNGSGTTTLVAGEHGIVSNGTDINPAMIVVAKARLYRPASMQEVHRQIKQILLACETDTERLVADGLGDWFSDQAAHQIRALRDSILRLNPHALTRDRMGGIQTDYFSPTCAFYMTVMFITIRELLSPFAASNPTWIKRPNDPRRRLKTTRAKLHSEFSKQCRTIGRLVRRSPIIKCAPHCQISSSRNLPFPKATFDAVITSPPYCTRIDYIAATRPELCLLGYARPASIRKLRELQIGTTVIATTRRSIPRGMSGYSRSLLREIRSHQTKAAKTYYFRFFFQYVNSMARSLKEISRCLKRGGWAVFVVQDSYFKNIHVNLQTMISEMATGTGLDLIWRKDFPVKNSFHYLNPRAKVHIKRAIVNESALFFRKN